MDFDAGNVTMDVWPLLWVRDIEASIDFWTGALGFRLVGADGEPRTRAWCRVERDGASVMLQQRSADAGDAGAAGDDGPGADGPRPDPREPEATALYFVCDDVDAVHAELVGRGVAVARPETAPYGMRQLRVPEPDGHEVWFESSTSPTTAPGSS